MRVSLDLETRSPVDLKTAGAYVYFEHERTEVLMCAYAIEGQQPKIWDYRDDAPQDLLDAIRGGADLYAFNCGFERNGLRLLHKRVGWPDARLDQWHDTQARAAAMGLPRSLEKLAEVLGLPIQKDKEGKDLIKLFSLPRADGTFNDPARHPERFERFKAYCIQDVATEMAAADRLMPLSLSERYVWLMNQLVNDRGLRIDVESARSAIVVVEEATRRLNDRLREVTAGAVTSVSRVQQLIEWANSQGASLDSLAKNELAHRLEEEMPPHVREALDIRLEAAKASVAKLKSMLKRVSGDGRVRGTFLYHGASTGRESSVGVNFNNMPRPRKAFEQAELDPAGLFSAIRMKDPGLFPVLYGPDLGRPLHLIADAMRGFVWAAPGKEFISADYASIEGVVTAWLAGEDWKLKAMAEINADPSLPDLYRRTAAKILGLTTDVVTKKHWARQAVGKVAELALGFGGGVAAFTNMAAMYGVDLDALYEPVWESAPDDLKMRAERRHARCLKSRDKVKTDVMSKNAWLACELIKTIWRQENAAISKCWHDQSDAMRSAVRHSGQKFSCGKIEYIVAKGFLWSRLPSGRCLAYGSPRLKDQVYARLKMEDGTFSDEAEIVGREEAEKMELKGEAKIDKPTAPAVTVLGTVSTGQKYERFALYPGLNFENLVQATARDIMEWGKLNVERAGYPVVFSVYDEVVSEIDRGFGSVEEYERLLCQLPAWAEGMPVSASGWRGKRYRKG